MRKVFIYGGCTSRDAVDQYADYGLELHSYIARQSLISAYRPADAKLFDPRSVEGSFQRRMLAGDIVGTLPQKLEEVAAEIDLVVWDLMIERVGVQKVASGGMITRNGTPRAEGVGREAMGGSYVFGTDPHFRQWEWAFAKFTETLDRIKLRDRIVVNATPWALYDKHGDFTRSDSDMTPEWFNAKVERYWQTIADAGLKVARVPQAGAIADPDHRWGPAYFHYVPGTYRSQLRAITALL